jgi:hypothetical protein
MPVIQLDSVATAKLRASSGPVEFIDDKGELIGQFQRIAADQPLVPWDPNYTLEDARRDDAEGGGSSIEEFWKEMGVK